MSDEVQIIDPCTSRQWMEFIHEHPDADIFHHPAWLTMLRDVYGFRMFAVCLSDDGRLRAGIPFAEVDSRLTGKRWVSVPFSDYSRPLLPKNNPEAIESILAFLKDKQQRETSKIEIRWLLPNSNNVFVESDFVYHLLHLGLPNETLFRSFDKKGTQWAVRQAEKSGVKVRECTTAEEFEKFYRLSVLTRKRLGVPAQPRSFFDAIWRYMIKPGLGFVLVSYRGAHAIAGGVFLKFNKTISFKYSASDREFRLLQPNHAFVWNAIQRANDEGFLLFNFGRSDKANEGLRRFKRAWSAEEHELFYSVIADKPSSKGNKTIESLMGIVIRHSPTIVCRVTGELLYKHVA